MFSEITPKTYHFPPLPGMSERCIQDHLALYRGYIARLNETRMPTPASQKADANPTHSQFRSSRTAQCYAENSVRLHELYFEALGAETDAKPESILIDGLRRYFGSYDEWVSDFVACSMSSRSWAILSYDTFDGSLRNIILDAPTTGGAIGCVPVLVLDVCEHAYWGDYGTRRNDYIRAFLSNINWQLIAGRYATLQEGYYAVKPQQQADTSLRPVLYYPMYPVTRRSRHAPKHRNRH